jgi:hypothetical protein
LRIITDAIPVTTAALDADLSARADWIHLAGEGKEGPSYPVDAEEFQKMHRAVQWGHQSGDENRRQDDLRVSRDEDEQEQLFP